jgi:hypothetical protein
LLIVDQPHLFPDNWIYVHAPDVRLGRIQNFKAWSPEMVPDPSLSSLGLEYFVQEGDALWRSSDAELLALGRDECARLGLVDPARVIDGTVLRVPKAYPVYDDGYREAIAEVRKFLDGIPNLQLVGRNGQHRYNNQDHSMLTALYAARNVTGAHHDVWAVNVESAYHEEIGDAARAAASGDRAVPQRASRGLDAALIRSAFARYDAVALGCAEGLVLGVALFAATGLAMLLEPKGVAPMLSLVGVYLAGYHVSWLGAGLGLVQAGLIGFAHGFTIAKAINLLVDRQRRRLLRDVERMRLMAMLGES